MEKCNFKIKKEVGILNKKVEKNCGLTSSSNAGMTYYESCPGEDNCILFQTYKKLSVLR